MCDVYVYLLIIAGLIVMGFGLWYTREGVRKQQNSGSEYELKEPSRNAVVRPFTHNPTVVLYIVVPIVTLILGIVVWLLVG